MIAHPFARKIKPVLMMAMLALAPMAAGAAPVPPPDGRHAFDFEFGAWDMHVKRLTAPLSGSTDWAEYDGPSVVHPIWGGAANVGEIDIAGPQGRIQGMSVRVYDPQSGQWRVSFANAAEGMLGAPMIGGFAGGRGEFYNQETFDGRAIFVRFVFSDITPTTFRLEQAFSADGGKTWEANWIATFRKRG